MKSKHMNSNTTPHNKTTSAHFVTGATGFVGGALVLELLQRTDDVIVCLVRPGEQDPQQRLWNAIDAACVAYDTPAQVAASVRERVIAVAGDVEANMCGVKLAQLPQLSYRSFWHSAASLRFEDRYVEQIMSINVAGTRHALALALSLIHI
jgi:thioester reductase-like protein